MGIVHFVLEDATGQNLNTIFLCKKKKDFLLGTFKISFTMLPGGQIKIIDPLMIG